MYEEREGVVMVTRDRQGTCLGGGAFEKERERKRERERERERERDRDKQKDK